MQRFLLVVLAVVGCISDGGEPEHVDTPMFDGASNTVFIVEAPAATELAAWRETFGAAADLWGEYPEPVQVWLVHEPGQPVGPNGDVWSETEYIRFFTLDTLQTLCIASYHSESQVQFTTVYALTMLYWLPQGIESGDEFIEKFYELLDVVRGE